MLTISSPQQATMLQLQYISESCGLRRSYLESDEPQEIAKPAKINEPIASKSLQSPENATPIVAPDIEWYPSYHTFQKRVNRLAARRGGHPTALPKGFPEAIHAPRVWSGLDFVNDENFVVQLTELNILEIENGLTHFKGTVSNYVRYFSSGDTHNK